MRIFVFKNLTAQTTLLLLLLITAPIAQSQSVVRLFSTPAERAQLERQRIALYRPDLQPTVVEEEPELSVELPPLVEAEEPDIIYSLGGSVQRSDGLYTVWLNGNAVDQESLPGNMELLQPFQQGRLRIRHPDSGAVFELKPGQVLNLTTGELFESYEYDGGTNFSVPDESITDFQAEADTLESQSPD